MGPVLCHTRVNTINWPWLTLILINTQLAPQNGCVSYSWFVSFVGPLLCAPPRGSPPMDAIAWPYPQLLAGVGNGATGRTAEWEERKVGSFPPSVSASPLAQLRPWTPAIPGYFTTPQALLKPATTSVNSPDIHNSSVTLLVPSVSYPGPLNSRTFI